MSNFIREFIKYFSYISTGTLLICAVDFALFGSGDSLPATLLPEMLAISTSAALATAVCLPERDMSKREAIIRYIVHYLLLNPVIISLGISFGWVSFSIGGVVLMAVSILVVYGFTLMFNYMGSKNVADELNKKIKERTEK
ncbi:MAG: DUF3021 family protein [Oscillospiraceae bacterium]